MSSEVLRQSVEAQENPVEFLRGMSYSAREGLPGFPEAREFTVHHVEEVAERKIVWFSSSTHSLDYSILTPAEHLNLLSQSSALTSAESSSDVSPNPLSRLHNKKEVLTLSLEGFTPEEEGEVSKIMTALKKQNVILAGATTSRAERRQTAHVTARRPKEEPSNHNYSASIDVLGHLMEAYSKANHPETATLARMLRTLIVSQKKQERQVEVVPKKLQPLSEKAAEYTDRAAIEAWLRRYLSSGYHHLGNSTTQDIIYGAYLRENSPEQIITAASLLPDAMGRIVHKAPTTSDLEIQKFIEAFFANAAWERYQYETSISASPTFRREEFSDNFFNPKNRPPEPVPARLKETKAFGRLVVGLLGVEPPKPDGPAEKAHQGMRRLVRRNKTKGREIPTTKTSSSAVEPSRYSTQTRELIGIGGPDSELAFYLTTPGSNGDALKNTSDSVCYAFELRCPKTKTAEEVRDFLLNHPSQEMREFFQSLTQEGKPGKLICPGPHFLRFQLTPDPTNIGRVTAAKALQGIDSETKKLYNKFMNPVAILVILGTLDPDSIQDKSQRDMYQKYIEPTTFTHRNIS